MSGLALNVEQAYRQFMDKGGWRDPIYGKHPEHLFRELFTWRRGIERLKPNLKIFYPCIDVFESCLNYIIQDKALDRINKFSTKLAINPNFSEILRMIIIDFLCRLIEGTHEGLGWVIQAFEIDVRSLYERLERFLYAKTQLFEFILPIANFKFEEHSFGIEIDDNLKIMEVWREHGEMKRVYEVFKETLAIQQRFPPSYALVVALETEKWGNIGTPGNKLVLTNNQIYSFNINADFARGAGISLSNVGRLPIKLEGQLYRFITALRLLKSGDVGFTALYIVSPRPMSRWMAISPPIFMLPRRQVAKRYILATNEVEQVKALLSFLSDKHAREIRLALDRFNYSYQRESMEDRLIDYVIVLEALLLRESLELKYRLSLRTAVLLGKGDEQKADEIFRFIRQVYDLRGDIVHGRNITRRLRKMGMPLEEVVSKLEGYARDSIREMFAKYQQYCNKEEILELLNKMILKPSIMRKSLESGEKGKHIR